MIHLKECKQSSVICSLARSLGTLRPDESDSLLPAKRMPMGLIEYCINFFNSSSVQHVCCPSDYRSWLETMYVLFGTKWFKIFSGPLWSHGHSEKVTAAHKNGTHSDPTEAFLNVPALSDRTIRRDIAASDFTTGPDIQMGILKRLATLDPTMGWWIKGDGTDVVKGLWESVSGKWAGDVDLNDGKLAAQYKQYQDKITWLKGIGLRNGNIEDIKQDLLKAQDDISTEIDFVLKELQKANDSYQEHLTAGSTSDQTMFSLSWDVQELKNIDLECRQVYSELRHCSDSCRPESFQEQNIPRRLVDIRQKLCKIIKRISHYRRTPATHVFVIMISSESRNKKPYALPVQCIPYSGLKEVELRRLISGLCKEMTTLGMKVSGFASDGEFNYLRTKGYTRPLSVFQVRNNVRKIYSKMSMRKMLAMITPKGQLPNGSIQAEDSNSIVPECVLCLIWL
ncbi:uncharacterized protein [Dysidea avara]|uniref:uncharacterized protein isoform X2 n=1 Tax=Dysidea avara TaxID=196820 RepID=UPI00332A968A